VRWPFVPTAMAQSTASMKLHFHRAQAVPTSWTALPWSSNPKDLNLHTVCDDGTPQGVPKPCKATPERECIGCKRPCHYIPTIVDMQ
jgi:hypothetical protein